MKIVLIEGITVYNKMENLEIVIVAYARYRDTE
jgi:hypothetical protein